MLPMYTTKTFVQVFEDESTFVSEWKDSGIYKSGLISDENIQLLYFLLFSKYGNSPIANLDETQFKYKCWTIIFQYGPTWQKRLAIQEELRALSLEDAAKGATMINNHAFNPSATPSTSTTTELPYINEQTTQKHSKAKVDAAAILWELIETDVTAEFLNKFANLFRKFVTPGTQYIFVTETEEGEDD